jgi:hypothetical protein
VYGVEPICTVLQVAPSGYWRHAAQQRNPALRCARAQRDDRLIPEIRRVWHANLQVYGADKIWKQMNRDPRTHEYVARRTAQGMSNKEIQCCLKRWYDLNQTASTKPGAVHYTPKLKKRTALFAGQTSITTY